MTEERTAEDQMKLIKRHRRLGWLNFTSILASAYFGVSQVGNYLYPTAKANTAAYSDQITARNSAYVQLSNEFDIMGGQTRRSLHNILLPDIATNDIIGTQRSIQTNNDERVSLQKLALIEKYANQLDEEYNLFLEQNSNHLEQVELEREAIYQQTLKEVHKNKVADWFKLGGSLTLLGLGVAERRRTLRKIWE